MNQSSATIDVVIPAYNGAAFIEDTIRSVREQTVLPTQIIVVDDGSTDDTEILVKKIQHTSSVPIHYIKKENGGPNSARNAGLAACTSDYVAFLDADDRWMPEKLEKQLALFTANTNLGLVYTDCTILNLNTKRQKILTSTLHGTVFPELLLRNSISGSASGVCIPRAVFAAVGTFDERLHIGEDWDMWLRIAEHYPIDFVPESLVCIQNHSTNRGKQYRAYAGGMVPFYTKWVPKVEEQAVLNTWRNHMAFYVLLSLQPRRTLRLLPPAVLTKLFNEPLLISALRHIFKKLYDRL